MPDRLVRLYADFDPLLLADDVPVYRGDFNTTGEELGMRTVSISRTWKGITRHPAPELIDLQTRGRRLSRNEQLFLDTVSSAERAMYLGLGALSFMALQDNLMDGTLSGMRNVSRAGLTLVEHTLIRVHNEVTDSEVE